MKIIVSHDIDHITFWEHKTDMIIPKFIMRSLIELGLGYISNNELIGRIKSIIRNKFHNIENLARFNRENGVPATYFIGVANGRSLKYPLVEAEKYIKFLVQEECDVGVHGIAYNSLEEIKKEHDVFKNLSGRDKFGIRMHYLSSCDETLELLNAVGYQYDSTLYTLEKPFKYKDIWEFPLHIMDVDIISNRARWQNQSLKQVIDSTRMIIDEAYTKKVSYLTINLHDRYFNDSFRTWKAWYVWVIQHLKDNNLEFQSFSQAIQQLENIQ